MASLHSALGLNFSDDADSDRAPSQKIEQPVQEEVVETGQTETGESESTQNEPEQSNDDEFRLQPVQPIEEEAEAESEPATSPKLAQEQVSSVDEISLQETSLEKTVLVEAALEESGPPATEEALQWAQHVKKMDLTGTYHQIAQSSTVKWLTDDKIQLTVEPTQDILSTDTAKQAIEEALAQYFSKSIKIEWQFAEPDVATPAMIWQRAAKAKHRKACEMITQHPFAQQLAQKFAATLDKNSIQYLDAQQ